VNCQDEGEDNETTKGGMTRRQKGEYFEGGTRLSKKAMVFFD
jgi:hypothetical protein